tara:strand:- start:480 stop:908 length:429 start_codon:yes stop_codon:yes gene_type:complete
MAKRGRKFLRVTNTYDQFEREVNRRAKMFVNSVMSVSVNYSKMYAPIAYSVLVNSQKTSITINGAKVDGTVGFYANYAVYLENGEGWEPKRPPKYGTVGKNGRVVGQARAWNPKAKPHFLRDSLSTPNAINTIENLKSIFKI